MPLTLTNLQTLMRRAERIGSQRPKDKNKLYALHASKVECIGKGKARTPYESGVKTGGSPKQAVVDLGFRGVDAANPGVQIVHRGKFKSLTDQPRRWLRRRQAVEPAIGHVKHDNAMDRCWLLGARGDALLCAADYNIQWLLRMIAKKGLPFLCLVFCVCRWRLRG